MDLLAPATLSEKQRRRRWPWLVLIALLSLGVIGGIYFYQLQRARAHLQRAIAEADRLDPGWTFAELESRRQEVLDDQNAILNVIGARNYLPHPKPLLVLEKLIELPPPEQLHAQEVRDIKSALQRVQPALTQVRKNLDLSTGHCSLAYTPDIVMTLMPHVDALSAVRLWSWLDVCRRAQERDLEGAFESARALFNSARGIGDDLFVISQMSRQSNVRTALRMVERILAQGEVSDRSLAEFQRLVQEEESFPSLLICARGERATLDVAFQRLDTREAPVTNFRLLGQNRSWTRINQVDDMLFLFSLGSVKEMRASVLECLTKLVEAAKLPVEELERHREELEGLFENLPPKESNLFAPFKWHFVLIYQRSRAELRAADVMLALERYRMSHGHWPESVSDLVPAFLSKVPLDPFDAAALRYRKLDDGCVVYSIGADKKDDGGDIVRTGIATKPVGDFGFRLWNTNARRQPANPDRLQASETSQH
jgi:hypothetical protein